jgi:hypothetical protein
LSSFSFLFLHSIPLLFVIVLSCVHFEPEKEICIWLNFIHNQHLSETWIYERRSRLWFIFLCNLLVTLFETNILSLCLVFFYRWCSLPSWILLLYFKGKDLISFMNIVFSDTFIYSVKKHNLFKSIILTREDLTMVVQ